MSGGGAGRPGKLWGCDCRHEHKHTHHHHKEVYVYGTPEELGNLRSEPPVLPAGVGSRPVGWVVKEFRGVAIHNHWAFYPWYKKLVLNPWKFFRELFFT